jgi:hypothetical protein
MIGLRLCNYFFITTLGTETLHLRLFLAVKARFKWCFVISYIGYIPPYPAISQGTNARGIMIIDDCVVVYFIS